MCHKAACSYDRKNEATAVSRMNRRLDDTVPWGQRGQLAFAPQKSQLTLICMAQARIYLIFDSRHMRTREELEILGVTYSKKTFIEYSWQGPCTRPKYSLLKYAPLS